MASSRCRAARLPISCRLLSNEVIDNRDILWHTYTLGEQCLDDSACKHVVEAVDAVDANAFAKQQLCGCASP